MRPQTEIYIRKKGQHEWRPKLDSNQKASSYHQKLDQQLRDGEHYSIEAIQSMIRNAASASRESAEKTIR